jgi:hypothetical protein
LGGLLDEAKRLQGKNTLAYCGFNEGKKSFITLRPSLQFVSHSLFFLNRLVFVVRMSMLLNLSVLPLQTWCLLLPHLHWQSCFGEKITNFMPTLPAIGHLG